MKKITIYILIISFALVGLISCNDSKPISSESTSNTTEQTTETTKRPTSTKKPTETQSETTKIFSTTEKTTRVNSTKYIPPIITTTQKITTTTKRAITTVKATTTKRTTTTTTISEKDVILKEKDFFYKNNDTNIKIWHGMDKKECVSLIGKGDVDLEFFPEEYCDYEDIQIVFFRKKLEDIHVEHFENWNSYKGINFNTTKKELIEILGLPTIDEAYDDGREIYYFFTKVGSNKYKKVKPVKKVKELDKLKKDTKNIDEMKVINIWFNEKGKMDVFDIGYFDEYNQYSLYH